MFLHWGVLPSVSDSLRSKALSRRPRKRSALRVSWPGSSLRTCSLDRKAVFLVLCPLTGIAFSVIAALRMRVGCEVVWSGIVSWRPRVVSVAHRRENHVSCGILIKSNLCEMEPKAYRPIQ